MPELHDAEFVWPNGLVFSPDSSKLYLAVSSPEDPAWYVYDVGEDGGLTNRRLFLDGRPLKEVRHDTTRHDSLATVPNQPNQNGSDSQIKEI